MTQANPTVDVAGVRFGNALPLSLIAGPCALESRDHAFDMAGRLNMRIVESRRIGGDVRMLMRPAGAAPG